jgi:hypothetical protein
LQVIHILKKMIFVKRFKGGYMYRYELSDYEPNTLASFATTAFKNVKRDQVPPERSAFDNLIDSIVIYLKVSLFIINQLIISTAK